MTAFRSSLLKLLDERGYIHQATDAAALDALASAGTVAGYVGFDATAPSLHVGHLVQIFLLRRLQQAGHKPIVLMGGGTTKVGDPSGKDESRQLLTHDQIQANIAGIRKVFERFLTFGDGPTDAVMLDNDEWLSKLDYVPFLREVGRHFTINRMLTFDSVKFRLEREQPLTFLEFNYMILQAYDFLELSRRAGCRLQLGGSDQWGNIVNGIELGRRVDGAELYGVTTPLITTADGAKMGKTAQGAVWLNADMCAPYQYWQFWRDTADEDVIKFLKLFTDLDPMQIALYKRFSGAELNECKVILANEATKMLHGEEAARTAENAAKGVFEASVSASGHASFKGVSAPVSIATEHDLALPMAGKLGAGLPTLSIGDGMDVLQILTQLGFVPSRNEARRRISEGAVRVDGEIIRNPQAVLQATDGTVRISLGKKKHGLLVQ